MANEPMARQLTVGELRNALEGVPDEVVVGLKVAPGEFRVSESFTLLYNLVPPSYQAGPVFIFKLMREDQKNQSD